MAAITLVLGALIWGGFVRALTRSWREVALLALPLPLSTVINLLVKRPLILGVASLGGVEPEVRAAPFWFVVFVLFVAPVTEELVKLSPLLLPRLRTLSSPSAALVRGFALGAGFGLGEVVYVAYRVSQSAQYADVAWYEYTGFLAERIAACFIHGALTALVVSGIAQGRERALRAYGLAVSLHATANVGPLLYQMGVLPAEIAALMLAPLLIVLGLLFEAQRRKLAPTGRAEAEELYVRPLP